MKNYIVIVKFLIGVVGLFAMIGSASAGNYSNGYGQSVKQSTEQSSYIKKTSSGRCHKWRYICADEWGRGSGEFHRCLRRHDCSTGSHSRRARKECREISTRCEDQYDYGTNGYRHCVRRYGCGTTGSSY